MTNPFLCERCNGELESDDAISIIEGICGPCRQVGSADAAWPGEPDQRPPESHPTSGESASSCRGREDPDLTEEAATGVLAGGPQTGIFAGDDTIEGPAGRTGAESFADWASHGDGPGGGSHPFVDSTAGRQHHRVFRPPLIELPAGMIDARPTVKVRRRARDLAVGMIFGLVVTGGVSIYLLTRPIEPQPAAMTQVPPTRPVTLKVEPPWAVVRLDDEVIGPPDESGALTLPVAPESGSMPWLEISADGYRPDRRPLSAFGGVDHVTVALVAEPYEAFVETEPARAEIWIDGELKGRSPLGFSVASRGHATLTVKRPGYSSVSQQLAPPAPGRRLDLHFVLEAVRPVLHVETEPPGARVTVDGGFRGLAPVTVEFDASSFGKDVAIVASAAGREDAATIVRLPQPGDAEACRARLVLHSRPSEVEFWTVPPGGRVVVDGKDLGPAPATATFEPSETGKSVIVQASLAGSYFGRQELAVPPAGQTRQVTLQMRFNAQRVAFLLSLPFGADVEGVALKDQLVEQIHRLTPQQRFAVLALTDDGLDAWPGGSGTRAATSEQKVRAYDRVRLLRPSAAGKISEMMRKSLEFRPTTIWLFAAGEVATDELMQFSEFAKGRDLSVHLVKARASQQDAWIEAWTARYGGTVTILDRAGDAQLPRVSAIDEASSD